MNVTDKHYIKPTIKALYTDKRKKIFERFKKYIYER